MTLQQLHSIPKFTELFSDERFVSALRYLREHPEPKRTNHGSDATALIRSDGMWYGWFDCLEKLEDLGRAIPPPPGPTSGRVYADPRKPSPTS